MTALINHWGDAWISFFGVALAQNTLFLILVFAALICLPRASAKIKYIIAAAGLIKLFIPPFIPLHIPSALSLSSFTIIQLAGESVMANPNADSVVPHSISAGWTATGLLFAVWACIFICILLVHGWSALRLRLILRCVCPILSEPDERDSKSAIVKLYRSNAIAVPLSMGLFRSRIYVPAAWDRWSQSHRTMMLQHELAHIQRHDGLFLALQVLTRAIYWFHPLVWLLDQRVNQYREMACDDAAVGANQNNAITYSRLLMTLAETLVQRVPGYRSALAFIRRKGDLVSRIQYQIEESAMKRTSKTGSRIIFGSLVLLALPLSVYITSPPTDMAKTRITEAAAAQTDAWTVIPVTVKSSGDIVLDGKIYDRDTFKTAILEKEKSKPNLIVGLMVDGNVTMGAMYRMHKMLVETNLLKLTYLDESYGKLNLSLPPEQAREQIAQIPKKNIAVIQIHKNSVVILGSDTIPMKTIQTELADLLAANKNLIVTIQSQADADYLDFLNVLHQVKSAGIQRIFIDNQAI